MIDVTQFTADLDPLDTAGHLRAGRRAALNALVSSGQVANLDGPSPEEADGTGDININPSPVPFSIGCGIDAAVLETITRLQSPMKPKRKWWKVWA